MDTSTVTIIAVIIFALIAIFSFVVYQQRGEAEIKSESGETIFSILFLNNELAISFPSLLDRTSIQISP